MCSLIEREGASHTLPGLRNDGSTSGPTQAHHRGAVHVPLPNASSPVALITAAAAKVIVAMGGKGARRKWRDRQQKLRDCGRYRAAEEHPKQAADVDKQEPDMVGSVAGQAVEASKPVAQPAGGCDCGGGGA